MKHKECAFSKRGDKNKPHSIAANDRAARYNPKLQAFVKMDKQVALMWYEMLKDMTFVAAKTAPGKHVIIIWW